MSGPAILGDFSAYSKHSVNIGNARLYGMEEDLGLKGNQYQTAVSLYFEIFDAQRDARC